VIPHTRVSAYPPAIHRPLPLSRGPRAATTRRARPRLLAPGTCRHPELPGL